jgi:replicative DNA helicase
MDIAGKFHNYEAETMVLGSILLEPEVLGDLIITADHYYDPIHQKIYKWIKAIERAKEPINMVTIAEIAKERLAEIGGISYLMKLQESIPSTASIKFYEGIIIDHWRKREKYRVYQSALQNIDEEDIDSKTREDIESIDNTGRRRSKFSMRDHLLEKYSKMEEMSGGLAGAETGFRDLDLMTEGLEKKKLIIVPARPSVGKTAFAINVCTNAVANSLGKDTEVYANIFSLEMGTDQLTNRMLSNLGNVDGRKVKNPVEYFNEDDWRKYNFALQELSGFEDNMDICDESTISIDEIRARVRENMKEHPEKHHIVMIDYLQLIKPSAQYAGNRVQEISEISRALKNMAMDLNITVIALSQLSRGVEQRQDKRPMLSDIRESGSIEQDADIIIFLYRDDYYDKESENKNIIELIIGKNREGSTGTISLAYIKEFNKFINLETRYDQAS